MPDFVVKTAFRTKEEMSKTFKRMGLAGNKFAQKLVRGFGRIDRKALSTRKIIGGILGAAVIRRGFNLLQEGVGGVVQEFLEFDDAITAASAKFGILDRASDAFKELRDTAREVADATEFTPKETAEGLRFLAKAGWETVAAMKALPSFVDLATASEMDFARAADIATDVMGAFGLKSEDADKNLLQLVRVSDVLSKAVNMSNINMEDLFETIKFAGPIANTAGVSLEQFSAMAAFIGGAGIKGSMGGTALRTMFLNLIAPATSSKETIQAFNTEIKNVKDIKNNRKQLAALGIVLDKTGKLSPIETLENLSKQLKKLGPAAKAAALEKIFGKRAVSGAAVSLDGATGALQKFEKTLLDAGGTSKQVSEFVRQSILKRLDKLKSAAVELGFKFIEAFEKKIPGGIDAAAKAIRNFDIKPVLKTLRDAVDVAKDFLKILRDYKGVLVGVGVGFAALKIGAFVKSVWAVLGVAKAFVAIGGFKALFAGAAIAVGPVGALALALAGIAAGFTAIYDNWGDLGIAFGDIGDMFADLATSILKSLSRIVRQIPLIGDALGDALDPGGKKTGKYFDAAGTRQSQRGDGPRQAPQSLLPPVGTVLERAAATADFELAKNAKAQPKVQFLTDTAGKKQGGGRGKLQQPAVNTAIAPPGVRKAEESRQQIQFEGNLNITGAPPGSTMDSKTRGRGARPVRTEMLGAN